MSRLGSFLIFFGAVASGIVLLYSAPKRKHFHLRFILSLLLFSALAYFFPLSEELMLNKTFALLRKFVMIGYYFALTVICFDLRIEKLIFIGMAAVTMNRISHNIYGVLLRLPILDNIPYPFLSRAHVFEIASMIVFDVFFYFTLGRDIEKSQYYYSTEKKFDIIAIAIAFINMTVTNYQYFITEESKLSETTVYDFTLSCLSLVIQFIFYRMNEENYEHALHEREWEEKKKQYEFTKETIDAINMKCHDMRHKLRLSAIDEEERREIGDLISVYDNTIKTGNTVFDIIFKDYLLRFGKQNVKYTFMGDGSLLSFVKDSDLYALFGNAIENATEAVLKNEENKRDISVKIDSLGSLVVVTVMNYYSEEVVFRNDLPVTSKKTEIGNHGFGTKSMLFTAKKYGGNIHVDTKDNVYLLKISMLR